MVFFKTQNCTRFCKRPKYTYHLSKSNEMESNFLIFQFFVFQKGCLGCISWFLDCHDNTVVLQGKRERGLYESINFIFLIALSYFWLCHISLYLNEIEFNFLLHLDAIFLLALWKVNAPFDRVRSVMWSITPIQKLHVHIYTYIMHNTVH